MSGSRVGDGSAELAARVRMAACVAPGPECRRDFSHVRTVIFCGKCHQRGSAAGAVFARVETFTSKRVSNEVLTFVTSRTACALCPLACDGRSDPTVTSKIRYLDSTATFKIGSESATRASAAAKCSGNAFPRLAARRIIPAHAYGLKEYLDATSVSKTSDKEHATASLGNSEPLRIKHAPSHIPAIRCRGPSETGPSPS